MAQPVIIENDAGDRLQLVDGAWKPLGNARAPGASYLPTSSRGDPDKSEAAYFRQLREKDNTAVAAARTGTARARRMEGLLSKQNTGGIYGVPVVGSVAGWLDPEIREMDAIQSEVSRSKRQPGEGAISDFDAQQFLNMTYGKDKPTATNKALIQAQRLADDAALQRRQFLEHHYTTYGTANGAEEAWDRYTQDNPIFDPQSETLGTPVLNNSRQNWREYFGAVRGPGDRRATQAETDARRAAGGAPRAAKPEGWTNTLPKPQRAAAMMFKGSKAPGGSKANPFVPTSAAEFKGLPLGAWYLDDDGKAYQKGGR